MSQPTVRLRYAVILVAFVVMSLVFIRAYFRNIDDEAEYTRTVRHVVVNAYELQLNMHSLQYAYNSFVLGHPEVTKDDLDIAFGIVLSKYDTLVLGDTYKLISQLKGDIGTLLNNNYQAFLNLQHYFDQATPGDKNLTKLNKIIEEQLMPDVRTIVKRTRIGTNWKSAIWEKATKESRQQMRLAMFSMLLIILMLITLLILQFRATREALIKAEQAKVAKAKFLAVAGHDLRQPLQACSLLLSTLQAQSQTPDNARLFKGIHHSLESITELLNGMLDISRLDADLLTVNKEPIPVTPLVNKMVDRYEEQARNKNLQLLLSNPQDSYIRSDELLLERIISNLLSNAIRYTQQGCIQLNVRTQNHQVLITIKDDGPGISKEDQQIIFEEFIQLDNPTTDNQKGLGLGLSIVKRLCNLLGHELTLTSQPGKGSQFVLSLPKAPAPAVGLPNKARDQWSLNGVTVIVIEDDKDILSSFDLLLSTWGCKVITASTIEQAKKLAKDLKNSQKNSDDLLIISDYYLNRDYNGCDVIENIQQVMDMKIPAMVITAETDPDRLEEIQQTGNSVFRKPLKPATLRVAIQRLLRQV